MARKPAAKKTEATAAPAERSTETDKPVTKLAEVPDPAKVTDAKIQEITADDGTDTAENSANADAAETLKTQRKEAKKGDDPVGNVHAGGFQGEPG